ncbi:hypothetical protein DVA81_19115, partial [Acinetobacter baumannii]
RRRRRGKGLFNARAAPRVPPAPGADASQRRRVTADSRFLSPSEAPDPRSTRRGEHRGRASPKVFGKGGKKEEEKKKKKVPHAQVS